MGVNKNYLNQVSNPTGKVTFMQSINDRVGFVVERTSAAAIKQILAAEEAGIRQIWMNQAYIVSYFPLREETILVNAYHIRYFSCKSACSWGSFYVVSYHIRYGYPYSSI
ncbi:MAG: hypothetical protein WBZ36_15285 [Candidatus Nitrosopolaris sp.]